MELIDPTLSIVTINRNNGKGLEETIRSVAEQTFSDFQYIVIDGGSTDASVDVIKKYADVIDYWVSEPDKGIYHAMNKGIRQAKGEYLLFLNSGDKLYDRTILQDVLDAEPSEDFVFGDILYEGEGAPLVMPDRITLETFLGSSIGHGATFIRSTLFETYGLYNESNKIVSDWEFFLNALVRYGCTYRHITKVFTVYQQGGISVNATYNRAQAEERQTALKKAFPLLYDTIAGNLSMKEQLRLYENSRLIQLCKRLQNSRLNGIRNKYFRFGRK
jgi:glycosyltransferase involved in cell wall biosynthesis